MNKIYVVGSGLYGATVASILSKQNDVTVLESRDELGGNIASEFDAPSNTHVSKYGAHIFHTNSDRVWEFVNHHTYFNSYQHYVKGRLTSGGLVDLPFNLSLFNSILGISSPLDLKKYLDRYDGFAGDNLEAYCISKVGPQVYEEVVKNYTEKQWGRPCNQLPKSIISRLPIRFTHDRTYFNNAKYQGMPVGGYSAMIHSMLSGSSATTGVKVNLNDLDHLSTRSHHVFYSGQIDALFEYELGVLPYRGLSFVNTTYDTAYYQGAPVINDLTTSSSTRTIEHKLFYPERPVTNHTLVTQEFPKNWVPGDEPYYPIRDAESTALHSRYLELAKSRFPNVTFGGRLGAFMYYDMDQVIAMAMKDAHDYQ